MSVNGDTEHLGLTSSPAPPSKLRARIMAAGYKYKLLNDETQLDLCDEENDGSCSCTKSSTFFKYLILIMTLIIVGLLIALIVVVAHHNDKDDYKVPLHSDSQVCTTPQCVSMSAYILDKMDLRADPCVDMYQYACGGWVRKVIPPPDKGKWDAFSEEAEKVTGIVRQLIEKEGSQFKGKNSTAVSKMKAYYRSCMDTEKIEAQGTTYITQVIRKLGSWTVAPGGGNWDGDKWTLQRSVVDVHNLMVSALFEVSIGKDWKNASRNIMSFGQSGLTLNSPSQYDESKFEEAYLSMAVKIGGLLGGNSSDVRAKMVDVFNFEKQLAKIYIKLEKLSNPEETYNKMTLKELQDILGSQLDVRSYLSDSFHGRSFASSVEVIVATPTYFQKLGPILQATPKEVLANYMMWMVVQTFIAYLPEAFSEAVLDLTKVAVGVTELPARWTLCTARTNGVLGFATSALFVEENFSPESKAKVEDTLDKIKHQFIVNLDTVTWLDGPTRAKLEEKATVMTMKVGYPDWIMDPDKLDERYGKLRVVEGEFFNNRLHAIEYLNQEAMDKYDKAPDRDEWFLYPDTVNAYYLAAFNYVAVPAGILRPPFFTAEFPDAFNYGAFGSIVGHELTHGFDSSGRMFDKYGNLDNIWTPLATLGFAANSRCMVDQYSNYSIEGKHMNGALTINENIADNGGVKLAYGAYKAAASISPSLKPVLPGLNLTDDQLFFLGFSQIWCAYLKPEYVFNSIETGSHTLNQYRVIGVLSNSPEFAKVYNCEPNSPMNPISKCKVW